MYSESDLQDAVAAGALTPASAQALRDHVARLRASSVDEEHFRLLTGFNDIFVAIASVILLVAVAGLGNEIRLGITTPHQPSFVSGLFVAGAAWGLAEYFTRRLRMALPSILLLLAFVGGIAFTAALLIGPMIPDAQNDGAGLVASLAGLSAAIAAWFHWRRFMVPITVAAGAAGAAAIVGGLAMWLIPFSHTLPFILLLIAGLAIFTLAMRWDMSDPGRTSRRSDVAFWLHLTAAPMIAHSLFQLLGINHGLVDAGQAFLVILLYLAFGLVALAIDRRALLVSSLAYVLYALYSLFQKVGAVELSAALTALVIGGTLLLLSAFWHRARAAIVTGLPPALASRLPYLNRATA
jgi:MFS family permease